MGRGLALGLSLSASGSGALAASALPGPGAGSGLALGLWLSVATLAAALSYLSYRLGQSRERPSRPDPHPQTPVRGSGAAVQAVAAAPANTAEHAAEAEREQAGRLAAERMTLRAEQRAALRLAQAEVLQAAALPLLLVEAGDGLADGAPADGAWVVQQLNPAASALWPDVKAGQPLNDLLQRLQGRAEGAAGHSGDSPQGQGKDADTVCSVLRAALPGLTPGVGVESGGWRLACLTMPAPGRDTLLLSASGPGWAASAGQAPVPAVSTAASGQLPGPNAAEQAAGESENFSFTLSHDLRAPIRVVEGFTRIVKEDYGRLLDRVGNDHLDRVLGAAARMNLMIDALLTLARLSSQPLARQPVNLTQLAHYVIDDLKRHHPERPAQVDIEPGLTAVGDPTLLRLVLENLLGNAWKYSGRSASTCIEFKREAVDGRPAFVVRDQGAGFDMRSADRLFGLFQRLHSANDFPGTGVGLASVRRIVRRHGGEIWAEAEPGRGASFHFTLMS